MNEIIVFKKKEFGQIRTVEINEKVYFVASDVARALGYTNTRKAINDHCRWVTKCDIPHPQSKTKALEVNVIPKGDIVRLAAQSKLPSAEKFESWIFDEVIPSVLDNGGYIAGQETLSDEDLLARAVMVAQRKIEERNKIIVRQKEVITQQSKTIERQDRKLETQKPFVQFALNVPMIIYI